VNGPDVLGQIDRRTFLRGTAGGAAALAVATLLPTGCGGYAPVENLRFFTAKEYAVMQALASVFIAPEGDMPSAADVDVVGYLDRFLSAEPPLVRKQLKQAILLVEYGGIWWGSKRQRCTRMSAQSRSEYLGEWSNSDSLFRRQVIQIFRRACLNTYYSDARTWDFIDYDGPLVKPKIVS